MRNAAPRSWLLKSLHLLVLLPFALSAPPLLAGCDSKSEQQEREEVRKEKKKAAKNQCNEDTDCMITGCRGTLCRAAPDTRFCSHRLIFEVEGNPDRTALQKALREFVSGTLLPLEQDTIQIGNMGDSLMLSFHAPIQKRQSLVETLDSLETGGVYPVHPGSDAFVDEVLAGPGAAETSVEARAVEGGPRLLELPIPAGDIINRREVEETARKLEELTRPAVPEGAHLSFEPLLTVTPPVVRAWLLSPGQSVGFGNLDQIELNTEGEQIALDGTFKESGATALAALTGERTGQVVVFSIGQEVLAAPKLTSPIEDGEFHLSIQSVADDTALRERIERVRTAPLLGQHLRFSPDATARAEKDLECLTASPALAGCGCTEDGLCQWEESEALQACMGR